jgi:hypothetical protein
MRSSLQHARDTIYNQEDMPLAIKRSAWRLLRHEADKVDPNGRRIGPRRALVQILKWMHCGSG